MGVGLSTVAPGSQLREPPVFGYVEGAAIAIARITEGTLRDPLVAYTIPIEQANLSTSKAVSGILRDVLLAYDIGVEEATLSTSRIASTGNTLETKLIEYQNWAIEEATLSLAKITGGTLT